MSIRISYENKRGCGYRKGGGLYLVSGNFFGICGKLPVKLDVCPCCGEGIKPARGWTWVSDELFKNLACDSDPCKNCTPFNGTVLRMGLIWIGEKFYSTPEEFMREGIAQGISRRISAVPRDFKVGETWVVLGHRKVLFDQERSPGIFTAFRPTAIEYVVRGDESQEELDALEKRGISLVDVKPLVEHTEIKF